MSVHTSTLNASVCERIDDQTFNRLIAVRRKIVAKLDHAARKEQETESAWQDHAKEVQQ